MAKYSFSFTDDKVVILDERTNKVDVKLDLLAHVDITDACRILTQGRRADTKASDAAISMLADVLASPILDEYRGNTPAGEKIPSTFASAVRDVENALFKGPFVDALIAKGQTPGKADAAWQAFRKDELNTGSYSNAKSMVAKLFCHVGERPNIGEKLLPLYAIKRKVDNWQAEQEKKSPLTIADRLVGLALEIDKREEGTKMGNPASAVAALKAMLATYEGLLREEIEALETNMQAGTAHHPDVAKMAQAATRQASKASEPAMM